jgi:hypothetical protein
MVDRALQNKGPLVINLILYRDKTYKCDLFCVILPGLVASGW